MLTMLAFNAMKTEMQRLGYTVKIVLNYTKNFTLFLKFFLMDAHVDLQRHRPHEHQRIACLLNNVSNTRKGLENAMGWVFQSEKAVKTMPPTPYKVLEVLREAKADFDKHMFAIRTSWAPKRCCRSTSSRSSTST
ncbi:hypothetical protein DPMN_119333 [Dreissena polymorpha]|uniref:Uncharacterized protein n=2 Tax=Dreissena polymorpha TaxID=45954 RepID=A0A9D4GJ17_DREPO|nr:hypothetical protein DPMN_119333 [Dreissena polymorpha]